MSIRTTVVLLATAVTVALPVRAVESEPSAPLGEPVALDTVLRLLNIESVEQLVLGSMPDALAEQIPLPDEVEIVGTISPKQRDGSHHNVAGESGLSRTALLKAFTDSLLAGGWERLESQGSTVTSGFAASGRNDPLNFCGPDDANLMLSVSDREKGPTAFNLYLDVSSAGSNCEAMRRRQVYDPYGRGESWADELIPVLEAPEGAEAHPSGRSQYGDVVDVRAVVVTELPPNELVDHYAGQLTAAGWVVGGTSLVSRIGLAEVSTQAPDGRPVTGFLMAECGRGGGTNCQMRLSITQSDEP